MVDADLRVQPISDEEFEGFRRFIYDYAGISLLPQKRHMVATRLLKRLHHYGLESYGAYYRLVTQSRGGEVQTEERQLLVDLLTTNETYFFREPVHFDLLRERVLPGFRGQSFRAWSAACSSGEEVYTLAMVCAEVLGQGDWEILGSDISRRVLEAAQTALYPLERARGIPPKLLGKYCLKGVRSHEGYLTIDPRLRRRVRFRAINLKAPLTDKGKFDVIFLRNVLIYFDVPTKREVVTRVAGALRPGGYLFTSHVESLHGICERLHMVRPSVFRVPAGE